MCAPTRACCRSAPAHATHARLEAGPLVTLVLGRIALTNSLGSVASTRVHSTPHWVMNWLMNSFVPP